MTVKSSLLTVEDAAKRLNVSASTVRRRMRSGALPTVRRRGRLVPEAAIEQHLMAAELDRIPPFALDNPMFRMIGKGRSGGRGPGARDKYGILASKCGAHRGD